MSKHLLCVENREVTLVDYLAALDAMKKYFWGFTDAGRFHLLDKPDTPLELWDAEEQDSGAQRIKLPNDRRVLLIEASKINGNVVWGVEILGQLAAFKP